MPTVLQILENGEVLTRHVVDNRRLVLDGRNNCRPCRMVITDNDFLTRVRWYYRSSVEILDLSPWHGQREDLFQLNGLERGSVTIKKLPRQVMP